MKHGKKYTEAAKLVDRATFYEPNDAIALVKKTATAKFDETIEVHIRTGCDGRHAEQQIRGAVCSSSAPAKRAAARFLPPAAPGSAALGSRNPESALPRR